MSENWWITPAGEVIEVEDHMKAAIASPTLFCLTEDEIHFLTTNEDGPAFSEAKQEALLNKLCKTGFIQIGKTRLRHPKTRKMVDALSTIFWELDRLTHDRLVRWAIMKHIDPMVDLVLMNLAGAASVQVIEIRGLLRGYLISRDPSRFMPCDGCGLSISKEELVSTMKCPRCGNPLA